MRRQRALDGARGFGELRARPFPSLRALRVLHIESLAFGLRRPPKKLWEMSQGLSPPWAQGGRLCNDPGPYCAPFTPCGGGNPQGDALQLAPIHRQECRADAETRERLATPQRRPHSKPGRTATAKRPILLSARWRGTRLPGRRWRAVRQVRTRLVFPSTNAAARSRKPRQLLATCLAVARVQQLRKQCGARRIPDAMDLRAQGLFCTCQVADDGHREAWGGCSRRRAARFPCAQ